MRAKSILAILGATAILLILFYSNQIIYGNLSSRPGFRALSGSLFARYQWKKEFEHLNGPKFLADDPQVVEKLRRNFLFPPSTQPYNLTDNFKVDQSMGQAQKIRQILNFMKGGFFVECGALDGETRSNTLYMEKELGWEGLLVEADPANFAQMVSKHRKAWLSPACLSVKPYPTMVSFQQKQNEGRISQYNVGYLQSGYVDVQCFPLWTFMLALNRTRIDYFSLDVEGLELQILQTIPFDKLDIQTLSVEFIHDQEGKEAIRNFMEHQGYYVDSEVTHPDWLANDFIFVKRYNF